MELNSKLSEADFREFNKMTRSKMYWFAELLAPFLILWFLWDPIVINLLSANPNWEGDGIAFAILVCGSLAYLLYRKQSFKQALAKVNARTQRVILNDEDLEWQGTNGAGGFLKWSRFQGWREGQQVILLEKNGAGFYVLPLTNSSEIERQSVRKLLQNHITYIPPRNKLTTFPARAKP